MEKQEKKFVLKSQYGTMSAVHILIARIFSAALSLLILWTGVENGKAFFNSLMIFGIGQFLFAISLKAANSVRKVFSTLVWIFIAVICFVAVGGLFGAIAILPTEIGHMIAMVRPGNTIYLFRADSFILVISVLLILVYVIEWGTSWFVPVEQEYEGEKEAE